MATNVVDRKDLQDWIEGQIKKAVESVMSKNTSHDEAMYVRGKHAVLKQLKIDFKL